MKLIRFIGPWLLVGGGPQRRSNSMHRRYTTHVANRHSSCLSNKHFGSNDVTHVFIPNHASFENHVTCGEVVGNHVIHRDETPITDMHQIHDTRTRVGSRLATNRNFAQNCNSHCNNTASNNTNANHHRNAAYYSVIDNVHDSVSNSVSIPKNDFHQSPNHHSYHQQNNVTMCNNNNNNYSRCSCANMNNVNNVNNNNNNNHHHHLDHHSNSHLENVLESFVARLEMIHSSPLDKNELSESTRDMLEQWGYLARVVDRFFAVVYFIVNVLCLTPFIPFYAGWEYK